MADFYKSGLLSRYSGCLHAVTTKTSELEYEGSLALHTGEREKEIIQNRTHMTNALELNDDYHFIAAHQTHSDRIEVIKEPQTLGWHTMEDAVTDCDALITDHQAELMAAEGA